MYVTLRWGAGPAAPRLGLGVDAAVPTGGAGVEWCAYVADCDKAVARLREHGTPVLDEPADMPWGERMARVADPDGFRILIMTAGTQ